MAEAPTTVAKQSGGQRSFFQIYKKGQGYYTRTLTAVGAGVLLAGLANFIWGLVSGVAEGTPAAIWYRVGIVLAICVPLAVMVYWLVGVNRKSCDFMIATEGEMKKVNWTTQREIIAATKVVIIVTVLMAGLLFFVDIAFMNFFSWIGVLYRG